MCRAVVREGVLFHLECKVLPLVIIPQARLINSVMPSLCLTNLWLSDLNNNERFVGSCSYLAKPHKSQNIFGLLDKALYSVVLSKY